jgi:predicted nucleic acid-binding protein
MAAYFFDSSSLVKRFASETGSGWVSALFRVKTGHHIYCSRIALVEVVSALARKLRNGDLDSGHYIRARRRLGRQFAFRIYKVEVTEPLIAEAADLSERHLLRGYDAVQLASALQINRFRTARNLSSLIFVNADLQLSAAARSEGLTVEDPNDHR